MKTNYSFQKMSDLNEYLNEAEKFQWYNPEDLARAVLRTAESLRERSVRTCAYLAEAILDEENPQSRITGDGESITESNEDSGVVLACRDGSVISTGDVRSFVKTINLELEQSDSLDDPLDTECIPGTGMTLDDLVSECQENSQILTFWCDALKDEIMSSTTSYATLASMLDSKLEQGLITRTACDEIKSKISSSGSVVNAYLLDSLSTAFEVRDNDSYEDETSWRDISINTSDYSGATLGSVIVQEVTGVVPAIKATGRLIAVGCKTLVNKIFKPLAKEATRVVTDCVKGRVFKMNETNLPLQYPSVDLSGTIDVATVAEAAKVGLIPLTSVAGGLSSDRLRNAFRLPGACQGLSPDRYATINYRVGDSVINLAFRMRDDDESKVDSTAVTNRSFYFSDFTNSKVTSFFSGGYLNQSGSSDGFSTAPRDFCEYSFIPNSQLTADIVELMNSDEDFPLRYFISTGNIKISQRHESVISIRRTGFGFSSDELNSIIDYLAGIESVSVSGSFNSDTIESQNTVGGLSNELLANGLSHNEVVWIKTSEGQWYRHTLRCSVIFDASCRQLILTWNRNTSFWDLTAKCIFVTESEYPGADLGNYETKRAGLSLVDAFLRSYGIVLDEKTIVDSGYSTVGRYRADYSLTDEPETTYYYERLLTVSVTSESVESRLPMDTTLDYDGDDFVNPDEFGRGFVSSDICVQALDTSSLISFPACGEVQGYHNNTVTACYEQNTDWKAMITVGLGSSLWRAAAAFYAGQQIWSAESFQKSTYSIDIGWRTGLDPASTRISRTLIDWKSLYEILLIQSETLSIDLSAQHSWGNARYQTCMAFSADGSVFLGLANQIRIDITELCSNTLNQSKGSDLYHGMFDRRPNSAALSVGFRSNEYIKSNGLSRDVSYDFAFRKKSSFSDVVPATPLLECCGVIFSWGDKRFAIDQEAYSKSLLSCFNLKGNLDYRLRVFLAPSNLDTSADIHFFTDHLADRNCDVLNCSGPSVVFNNNSNVSGETDNSIYRALYESLDFFDLHTMYRYNADISMTPYTISNIGSAAPSCLLTRNRPTGSCPSDYSNAQAYSDWVSEGRSESLLSDNAIAFLIFDAVARYSVQYDESMLLTAVSNSILRTLNAGVDESIPVNDIILLQILPVLDGYRTISKPGVELVTDSTNILAAAALALTAVAFVGCLCAPILRRAITTSRLRRLDRIRTKQLASAMSGNRYRYLRLEKRARRVNTLLGLGPTVNSGNTMTSAVKILSGVIDTNESLNEEQDTKLLSDVSALTKLIDIIGAFDSSN